MLKLAETIKKELSMIYKAVYEITATKVGDAK